MRPTITALVIAGLSSVVAAQSRPADSGPPLGVLMPRPLPLPRMGFPLPPIGLPFPSIGLSPNDRQPRVAKPRPLHEVPRHRQFGGKPHIPSLVYVVPAYGFE